MGVTHSPSMQFLKTHRATQKGLIGWCIETRVCTPAFLLCTRRKKTCDLPRCEASFKARCVILSQASSLAQGGLPSTVIEEIVASARNDLQFLPDEQPEQPEQNGNNSAENGRISRVTCSDQRI